MSATEDETKTEDAPKTEEETVKAEDPDEASTAKAASTHQTKKDSDELTKRLQKLALERQKQSSGDRLKVIQSATGSHLTGAKTFQELNLPKHLLDAIFQMGFDRPSAIQEEALPRILADPPRNLIGQAQSGSGKTAAFTLGMLYRIKVDEPSTTQALCVTPTRELAIQIFDKAVKPMAANMMGLKIQLAIAGTVIERGQSLQAHLVIGTPGKVVEWLKRKVINTKNIKVFVLDEADNMVDESGHRANSLLIKKQMPPKCQSLLFSATFPPEVVQFAAKMVHNPDKILIEDGPEFLVRLRPPLLQMPRHDVAGRRVRLTFAVFSVCSSGSGHYQTDLGRY
jgi:ATP-dependent RNA helicase DDX19/DBP5